MPSDVMHRAGCAEVVSEVVSDGRLQAADGSSSGGAHATVQQYVLVSLGAASWDGVRM
jgi:hypothetical protein